MNNDDVSPARRDSRLDRAIDRAVRKMMHVDPPAGLRRRVLARIDAAPAPRPMFLWWYGFAAAALAMIVLAVVIGRHDGSAPSVAERSRDAAVEQPSRQPDASATARQEAPANATPQRGATDQHVDRTTADRPGTRRARRGFTNEPIEMPRVANVFEGNGSQVSAANTAPGPEDVVFTPAVGPDAVEPLTAITHIVITPLQIEPLRIDPLTPRK